MFIQSAATLIPHVEYNPATQQYLVAWWNNSGGRGRVLRRLRARHAMAPSSAACALMSAYY